MPKDENALVLLRGGGDLASGAALRLHRAGFKVVITELAQPLAVRRTVCFSETVYDGQVNVEGVTARLVTPDQLEVTLDADVIPVLVDPDANILLEARFSFSVVVDARMTKQPPEPLPRPVLLHIGLGPGFRAGENCHAVIETRRGHTLGRVYWNGPTLPDSRHPEGDPRRVLRAPMDGIVTARKKIGEHCEDGEVVAVISDQLPVITPFRGVLRGIVRDGLRVHKNMKIGDVDPRDDPGYCFLVSDKALAVGGGVLEAVAGFVGDLSRINKCKADLRRLW